MYFLISWKRSKWDGKIDAGMEGRESACSAAVLSTFLLPRMPLWPGTQMTLIGIRIVEMVIRVRIRATRRCEEEGLEIVRRAAREL